MSKSKESHILELFFNEPTRHWSFTDIKSIVPIADNKLSAWLKLFVQQGIITRIKLRKKMPYYVSRYASPNYQNRKRLFAFEKFYQSGFLNHLSSLDAKAVIMFGSFTRWDWHSQSDIDIFIYGTAEDFDLALYQKKLHREIQLFTATSKSDLKRMGPALLQNIMKGDLIKGDLELLGVSCHA